MSAARVIAAIATYRRPTELARLMDSLEHIAGGLHGLIVVDNASDPQTQAVVERSSLAAHRIVPQRNLGCGGGLRLAESRAFEIFPDLTHIWILDDDAVVAPTALELLLAAMESEHADAAHPLVEAPDGYLGWFPGLLDASKFRVIRQRQKPEEFIARCGAAPIAFSWSQGIALLVTREAFEKVGFHRDDYWVRGEDLEFSLRITHHGRGIYVPCARVQHLPPPSVSESPQAAEYAKHRAMLQNLAYTSLRQPHGRPLLRTLPGNWLRFVRTWGWRRAVIADAALMFVRGALLGLPAGSSGVPPLPSNRPDGSVF